MKTNTVTSTFIKWKFNEALDQEIERFLDDPKLSLSPKAARYAAERYQYYKACEYYNNRKEKLNNT